MRKIIFPKIPKIILLFVCFLLCMISAVIYITIYIDKNRNYIERDHAILLENQKLLIENQNLILNNIDTSYIYNDSIYKMILTNDSIIFEHMKDLENNFDNFK